MACEVRMQAPGPALYSKTSNILCNRTPPQERRRFLQSGSRPATKPKREGHSAEEFAHRLRVISKDQQLPNAAFTLDLVWYYAGVSLVGRLIEERFCNGSAGSYATTDIDRAQERITAAIAPVRARELHGNTRSVCAWRWAVRLLRGHRS
jgi:hypothetical protein